MKVVKYVGLAHERMITADDWKRAGYPHHDTEMWNYLNGFTVPADHFTDDELNKIIKPDAGFVIVGGRKDDVAPKPLPHQMTPQQAASVGTVPIDASPGDNVSTAFTGSSTPGPVTTVGGSGTD